MREKFGQLFLTQAVEFHRPTQHPEKRILDQVRAVWVYRRCSIELHQPRYGRQPRLIGFRTMMVRAASSRGLVSPLCVTSIVRRRKSVTSGDNMGAHRNQTAVEVMGANLCLLGKYPGSSQVFGQHIAKEIHTRCRQLIPPRFGHLFCLAAYSPAPASQPETAWRTPLVAPGRTRGHFTW